MISEHADGVILDVRVIPRAGKTGIAGTRANALLVRLQSAPVGGAANAELIALLARLLDLPRHRLILMSGEKTRTKRVKVLGATPAMLRERLGV